MAHREETVQIEGMGCDHCVHAVKEALEGLDGLSVRSVEIGKAVVEVEDDEGMNARIEEAIEDAGYSVSAIA
ncbi:MAG: heavy-metal-associated domain-containing protein [Bacteroidetes bacterium]|nr:heavy-metal-associated domain-containing protein [Bacteroidota bacterium]